MEVFIMIIAMVALGFLFVMGWDKLTTGDSSSTTRHAYGKKKTVEQMIAEAKAAERK